MPAQKYSGRPQPAGVKNDKGPIKDLKKKHLTVELCQLTDARQLFEVIREGFRGTFRIENGHWGVR